MSVRSEVIRIFNELMAGSKKITELTPLPTNVANDDLIEVVRGDQNYKATGSQLPSDGGTQDLQSVLDEGSEATLDAGEVVRVGIELNNDDQERIIEITEDGPSLKYVNDTDTMEVTVGPGGVSVGGTVGGVNQAVNIGSGGVTLNTPPIDADDDSTKIAPTEWVRRAVPNGLSSVDTTGTAISFSVPQIYGSDGSPETGNITIVTTGLVKGMTQLLIHNNGSEPTYGSEIKIISGAYATGELNYIMLLAVSSTLVLVTISQEI